MIIPLPLRLGDETYSMKNEIENENKSNYLIPDTFTNVTPGFTIFTQRPLAI